jgi:H/ACA ribonucleoprotein complex subunit 2
VQDKKDKTIKDEDTAPIEELSPIAQPLAQKKLLKKLHKTIKKGKMNVLSSQPVV